jgi:hypothetical protein
MVAIVVLVDLCLLVAAKAAFLVEELLVDLAEVVVLAGVQYMVMKAAVAVQVLLGKEIMAEAVLLA